jgi:hypothetical protein
MTIVAGFDVHRHRLGEMRDRTSTLKRTRDEQPACARLQRDVLG